MMVYCTIFFSYLIVHIVLFIKYDGHLFWFCICSFYEFSLLSIFSAVERKKGVAVKPT